MNYVKPTSYLLALALAFAPAGLCAREDKSIIPVLELSEQLSNFYANFTGVIEVTLGRAAENTTDNDILRTLTLSKLRLARACRAAAFQIDPRNALVDTWTLCVQIRIYADSDAPAQDLGLPAQSIAPLRDAVHRLERDIRLIAENYIPPAQAPQVAATIEQFCKEHPLSSARAITPPPTIQANAKNSDFELGKLLSLPLAPFHAMEGVDRTAQSVAQFARVANSIDHTVSNLPLETAWEAELLLLGVTRDLSALIDDKTTKLSAALTDTLGKTNAALAATLDKADASIRRTIDRATLRIIEIIVAIFLFSVLRHFITRRWFPKNT